MESDIIKQKGIDLYKTAHYAAALQSFKVINGEESDDYEVLFFIALAYERLGEHLQALKILHKVIASDDNYFRKLQSRLILAYILSLTGQADKAEGELVKLSDEGIEQPVLYALWGYVAEKNGDSNLAVQRYKKALEINSENATALNSLGYLYANSSDTNLYNEALILLRRAVSLDPKNASYLDSLGFLCYKMGKHDEALNYLTRAAEINKNSPIIKEHLAKIKQNKR